MSGEESKGSAFLGTNTAYSGHFSLITFSLLVFHYLGFYVFQHVKEKTKNHEL